MLTVSPRFAVHLPAAQRRPVRSVAGFGTTPLYVAYPAEVVKARAMQPAHQDLYDRLTDWAKTDLVKTEGGKRCMFPRAIHHGHVEFVVCQPTRTAIEAAFRDAVKTFEPLTAQNKHLATEKTVVIAIPELVSASVLKNTYERLVADLWPVHDMRHNGVLSLALDNVDSPVRGLPYSLMALRYLVPSDDALIPFMQNDVSARLLYERVYGPRKKTDSPPSRGET